MPLPRAHVQRIESLRGVLSVSAGVSFSSYYQVPANRFVGEALDPGRLLDVFRDDFVVSDEARSALQRTRTGVLVGRKLADQFGWKVGHSTVDGSSRA